MFVFMVLVLFFSFLLNFVISFYFLSLSGLSLSFSSGLWSFLFFNSLIIIVSMILLYSVYYLDENNNLYYHLWMFLFAISMIILIFHNNTFSLIIGWDGLGITSFLLVYYYSNWSSINSAFVTVLSNRLGDVLMLWFILQMLYVYSFLSNMFFGFLCVAVLFFAGITKSAQFPFSSWLPQAMAAPTPTSALVHSSTLVTAGIYLFIKYNLFFLKITFLVCLFLFGFITVVVSGFVSLIEKDSKKVIALSTLNQLGFMVSTLGMGNKFLVFFHLLTHAFFKSCMFLQMGFFIHNMFSNQDFRGFSSSLFSNYSSVLVFLVCLLSLSGVVFLSGFCSKEAVLFSLVYSVISGFSLFLLFFMVMFTLLYSLRLGKMVIQTKEYFEKNKSFVPVVSSSFLCVCGVGLGVWMSDAVFVLFNIFGGKEVLLIFFFFFIFIVFVGVYLFLNFLSNMVFQDVLYKSFNVGLNKFNVFTNMFIFYFVEHFLLNLWSVLVSNSKYKFSLFIFIISILIFFV